MDARRLLEELSNVARKLGLEIRTERFATPGRSAGGLCRIRGRQVVLLDAARGPLEQAASLAEALGAFELERVYMAPEARRFIEEQRARRAWQRDGRPKPRATERKVQPLPLPKPGLRRTKPGRRNKD